VIPFSQNLTMTASRQDVVYSIAIGMKPDLVETFVATFRQHNRSAAIIVGVGSGEATRWSDFARRWNVIPRESDRALGVPWGRRGSVGLAEIAARLSILRRLLVAGVGTSTDERARALTRVSSRTARRFAFFHEWLALDDPDRILISDTRDVLFQADPFADPQLWAGGVLAGEEAKRFRENETNRRWLGYVGHDATPFLDRAITCVGVTLGPRAAMEQYIAAMIDTLFTAPNLRAGADTGAHNWVTYAALAPVVTMPNGAGPIYTAGFVDEVDAPLSDGKLRNADDSVIPLIHQYDRWSPAFQRRLAALQAVSAEYSG
jgi:hypothetical protein